MRKKFIQFGAPDIGKKEISAVADVLKSGWVGTGRRTEEFEEEFRKFTGAKYAVAVSSCSAALHLGLLSLGIGRGHAVITTPLTFPATVNSIIHTGALPVFADIEPDTFNISPVKIEEAIKNRGSRPLFKAIVAVHFAGRPCNMDAIMKIAEKHGLFVIEDAAHALEAEYNGKRAGTIGGIGCFSFYPNKNITSIRGGMLVTDDKKIADRVRLYRFHGIDSGPWQRAKRPSAYRAMVPGFEYNMTDVEAVVGKEQIRKSAGFLRRRAEIWDMYVNGLARLPVAVPAPVPKNTTHARHLFTILIDKKICGFTRDQFRKKLHDLGIGTGIHYPSLHLEPLFKDRDTSCNAGCVPLLDAGYVSERIVSLPLYPKLSDADVKMVIKAVKSCFHG